MSGDMKNLLVELVCEELPPKALKKLGESFAATLVASLQASGLVEAGGHLRYLLHPNDKVTGIKYSSLAMIHAIIEDMLTPAQAREHLSLIDKYVSGPDGVRLFDRPMPYHGGTQRIFQRAETATFFGREIGLMYTHAHLRHAQALAHVGEADRLFRALCQANPIGIGSIVPTATLRQANCYYSSSDWLSTIVITRATNTAGSPRARSRWTAVGVFTRAARVSR